MAWGTAGPGAGEQGTPAQLGEVALSRRLPRGPTCPGALMVLLLLLRPPGSPYCSVAAVAQLRHRYCCLLCQELCHALAAVEETARSHLIRLRQQREAAEEGGEVRWKQNCGKSDQDPASTCQNRSVRWAFCRAALEVVIRPHQCGPAILAGQRSHGTEINDKAPHNAGCIRSGSHSAGES